MTGPPKKDSKKEEFATVTRLHARACFVVPEAGGEEVRCLLGGRLFERLEKETKPVAVGDRVLIDGRGKNPVVVEVCPRRNCLRRPAGRRGKTFQVIAANIDRMLVVASVAEPPLNTGLIDRFLVAGGIEGIAGLLCINKIDLIRSPDEREFFEACLAAYSAAGYLVQPTCARDGRGVGELKERLAEGITLIVGRSGVGKSTLLNAMDSRLELSTGDISSKGKTGRHTTTAVRLLRLDAGGFFIDTPGIGGLGISSVEPHQLGHYFPEIARFLKNCRFPTCTHDHEPGCAVRAAAEGGEIPSLRYENYLKILKEL